MVVRYQFWFGNLLSLSSVEQSNAFPGHSRCLQNNDNSLPYYTVLQLRRP